jgi:hypothetical protein
MRKCEGIKDYGLRDEGGIGHGQWAIGNRKSKVNV